jgi:thiol:disulfide interchange protein DsbA
MKRRDFSLFASSVLGSSVVGFAPVAQAQAAAPQAGRDYQVVSKRIASDVPAGKIEVVEFFWYNCGHCNAFEPMLDAWALKLPKDVVLRRVPVAFQDSFAPQQRLFYALEAMGLVAKLQGKVFQAIHAQRLKLDTAEAITGWVVQQGVDRAKFIEHYNSFSVASKVTKATQLQNAYQIEGVPALGVAGRFITDGSMARSMERALQVVDYLASEIRAGR